MSNDSSRSNEHQHDAVVIGSGIGGLSAALTLARAGMSVALLEAGKQFGGYTNPFKRGKYSFDPGLHYIGQAGAGQPLAKMLERLDLADKLRFRELSPDGFDRIVFPDYEVSMPKGRDLYHQRLAKDFPHERAGLEQFFSLLGKFHDFTRLTIARDFSSSALLHAAKSVPALAGMLFATYDTVLNRCFRDPLLKAVLAAQCGDYGLPPSRASAIIGFGLLDHYLDGAFYPVGGSRAIRDAFVDALHAAGATMLRNHPVEKIEMENGRPTGVRCANGHRFRAKVVVSNVDAMLTYRDLLGLEHLGPITRRRVQATEESIASICMFIGTNIDVKAAGMTDANIWNYPTTDLNGMLGDVLNGAMPRDDFFFLSAPTLKDPDAHEEHAPKGFHTLELVTLCPWQPFRSWEGTKVMKRGDAYEEMKDKLAKQYLQRIETYVPGISADGAVTVLEVSTPLTNVSFAAVPAGAIYGPAAIPSQMGPFRFQPVTPIEGLFLCGSSTFGGGITPAALSGFVAGRSAARHIETQQSKASAFSRLFSLTDRAVPNPS